MREVEILTEVLDTKDKALKALACFNFVGVKRTLDIYFFNPKEDELKPNKDGFLNKCFRLRKKGNKNYLAYKVDNFDKNRFWLYSEEHEVEVSDFEECLEILRLLGFEVLVEIENEKHIYLKDEYEIAFEDVKKLGLFLEVEQIGVKDGDNITTIKQKIWDFIKGLGIQVGHELNAGKPELMLKKLGKIFKK